MGPHTFTLYPLPYSLFPLPSSKVSLPAQTPSPDSPRHSRSNPVDGISDPIFSAIIPKTRPYTRQPQSRAGGQGQYSSWAGAVTQM